MTRPNAAPPPSDPDDGSPTARPGGAGGAAAARRPTPADAAASPTGRTSLDTRWWWSAALMIIVGVTVIGYQYSALSSGDGILLNWVMVVVGAVVAVIGLVSLHRAWVAQRDTDD